MRKSLWLLTFILLLVGCRNSADTNSSPYRVSMYTEPILPIVGDAVVVIRISKAPDNTPINDVQKIAIKADMTHAGMAPVLAETTSAGEDGYYRIPITFTMAGDWVIGITATLADGTIITHSASVAGIAEYVPNFEAIEDCTTILDENSTAEPDCIVEVTEPPLDFGINP